MKTALALFFGFFALYVHCMAPGLAPYRDTGEMVVSAGTLGVSHPPSYPLYILLGRAFENLPLAEPAYRLSLLSCAAGASAVALLFIIASGTGYLPALSAAFALGLNRSFWSVTTVPEMYSLGILLALVLLLLAENHARKALFLAFFAGLALGNRSDLVLWAPGIAQLLWQRDPTLFTNPRKFGSLLLCFFGGLTIYLYLPLRSAQGPLLDWNHPADLWNFWGTLTRRSYGGTLDLLSRNYKTGELFFVNLWQNLKHLRDSIGFSGLALAAAGLWSSRKQPTWTPRLFLYIASGPVFLFLANLPPNPHALAIVEPHWLLPDLLVLLWLASGLAFVLERVPRAGWAVAAVFLAELGALGGVHYAAACRRESFYLADFTRNVLRSSPPGALLVSKKDVQLFGLWYAHDLRGLGVHTTPVSEGMAGSAWYIASMHRREPALELGPLRDAADWKRFHAENPRPIVIAPDADLPQVEAAPYGMLALLDGKASLVPWEFTVTRGLYRYEDAQDFFASDLIDMVSAPRQRTASDLLRAGDEEGAERFSRLAWAAKWLLPDAPLFLGYIEFQRGSLDAAERLYGVSGRLYDRLLSLADEYHALPDVRAGILKSSAEPFQNLGVVFEKKKKPAEAEAAYLEALKRDPSSSKVWFNLGALFWNRDWPKSASAFKRASELDPSNSQARNFALQAAARIPK